MKLEDVLERAKKAHATRTARKAESKTTGPILFCTPYSQQSLGDEDCTAYWLLRQDAATAIGVARGCEIKPSSVSCRLRFLLPKQENGLMVWSDAPRVKHSDCIKWLISQGWIDKKTAESVCKDQKIERLF